MAGDGKTFLVHGEPEAMASFAALLPQGQIEMPTLHQRFSV